MIFYKNNPIDLGRTLKQQGISSSTILQLSNLKYMSIYVQYTKNTGLTNTKIFVPNNKTILELKAIITRRIPILKGQAFELHDNNDVVADDRMVRTVIKDGQGLGIITKSGRPIDQIGDDDTMQVDEDEHEEQTLVNWIENGKKVDHWIDFDYKGKTGKDLQEAITKYLKEKTGKTGNFTMKYAFHLITLNEELKWGETQIMPVDLEWGATYINPSQTATVIE